MQFKNSNGLTYEVLKLVPFTSQDKEYYKNSWQKQRYGLFKHTVSPKENTFIVASMVGDNSWGSGYYFQDLPQAEKFFQELEDKYKN